MGVPSFFKWLVNKYPKVVVKAIEDGVAPRAKMNQQRMRRFKSAKDAEFAEVEEEKLRRQFELESKQVLTKQQSEVSDSNIITPGTEFMHKLSKALRNYISLRLSNDLGWRDIEIILSDANAPGEGEHKIMSFIRSQRNLPSYDPNTRHCLYGLDADLVMLALATHELHFSILREDVLHNEQRHTNCESIREKGPSSGKSDNKKGSMLKKPYQFLHVWILREYLELDLKIDDPPENFKFDLERIIDDFIFMCFFAGNDFLPHMPTLEIHEGAIDLLMTVYKKELKNLGGYMVDMLRVNDKKSGYIKLSRVEKFILLVGSYEDKIFKKRSELRDRKLRRLCYYNDSLEDEVDTRSIITGSSNNQVFLSGEELEVWSDGTSDIMHSQVVGNTKELKKKLKDNIRRKSDLFKNGDLGTDKVRFAVGGYKERYYKYKFSAEGPEDIERKRKEVVKCYTEGLLWVLLYYFSEPPSWTWFYPFHYGPFASDLKGLGQVKAKFHKGFPFKPIDTLMAVLPPRSAHALPKNYQKLMTEESSGIIDFYPTDFEIDMDGKRFTWQGICKLPFIEEERLLSETKKLDKELVGDERDRNTEKPGQLFVRRTHNLVSQIMSLSSKESWSIKIDTSLSFGVGGTIRRLDAAMSEGGDYKLREDHVACMLYELPNSDPHMPRLLDGVKHPSKTITEDDLMETKLWHEYQGSAPTTTTTSSTRLQERYGGFQNNARCTSSSTVLIHKFAGSGWGCGRGKEVANPNSGERFYAPRGIPGERVMSSSSYSAMGSTDHKRVSFQGRSVSNDKWRAVGYVSGDRAQGFKDLKISEPSQVWRPKARGQPANAFWPSRNSFGQNTNHSWQSSQLSHSHGRGRGQQQGGRGQGQQEYWKRYAPFSANDSSQAGGRSQFVPRSSVNQRSAWS
ncbi:hypothetical protein C1H46_020010 [Malus baccata]|uniref:5'-3' exoribonuclease n=1 Tax=Malus baccata TaxID=106549 RepID=A0A540M6J6_MALBA|nr:hypothetical protein C1H46_020010 [Malus baccata]